MNPCPQCEKRVSGRHAPHCTPQRRFDNKVAPEPNTGCWLWYGGTNEHGYGIFFADGRFQKAHRLAYRWAHGDFDQSLDVLHSCDNPACVNPDHLRLGTHADNMRDMARRGRQWQQKQAHCKRGHPLTADNRSNSSQRCLICRRASANAYYARQRAKEIAA